MMLSTCRESPQNISFNLKHGEHPNYGNVMHFEFGNMIQEFQVVGSNMVFSNEVQ